MSIIIRNSNLGLLAYIDEYMNPSILERINGEYTFSFVAVIDGDKSEYINTDNIVEMEGQYFNIIHHRRMRNRDGSLMVQVDTAQVARDLNFFPLDNFLQAGLPADILELILADTDFTIGSVELIDVTSVSINEVTNKRAALIALAAACGGEILFDKYTISLLIRRGQNRGVQYRVGKNIAGIIKDVDKRTGTLKIAYEIDILELNTLEEYAGLEYFELGDTIKIIDPDIGVNDDQRIVEYEYDPRIRMNSRVVIANFIAGIQDTIVTIQKTTVVKDRLYYGTRIGPENGFETLREDNKARSIMNADMIKLQKGDGTGSNWIDVIYLDSDGNANFTGIITASQFIGGSIIIGIGDNVFKADENGIYLGNELFDLAPFSVSPPGAIKSTSGTIGGWVLGIDSIKDLAGLVGMLSDVAGGDDIRFFAGNEIPGSAPFRVTKSGAITSTSGAIGGWVLGVDSIKDVAGLVGMLSAVTGGDDIRFFAGNATPANAPFYVTEAGLLHASKIDVSTGDSYPKVSLLTSDGLLAAYASAVSNIIIKAYNNTTGAPYLRFKDSSDEVTIDLISSLFAIISNIDMQVIGPNVEIRASGGDITIYPASSSGKKIIIPFFDDLYADQEGQTLQAVLDGLQSDINGKQNSFSGYSGTFSVIDSVDFVGGTTTSISLTFDNGVLTSVV